MILFRLFKFWCQNVLVTNEQSTRWDFCLCLNVSKRDSKSQKEQNPSISKAHLKSSEDAEDPLEPNFIQLSPRAWLAAEAVTLLDFDKEPNESLEDVTEHEAAWQRNCQLLADCF